MQANVIGHLQKMVIFLYIFLLALQHVNALNDIPFSPKSAPPSFPSRLENAAVWHQAVTMDAQMKTNRTNQNFYLQMAWWQCLENSSVSYLSGATGFKDAGPYMSQTLQAVTIYPVRFDQAQASNPGRTPSRHDATDIQISQANTLPQSLSRQFLNKQSNLSVPRGHGGRTISTTFPPNSSKIYHSYFSPKTGSI